MKRATRNVALWIGAAICFGPLVFVLFLGAFLFPVWIGMIVAALSGAVDWVDGAGTSMWPVVISIAFYLGGIVGVFGLFRVLITLSRDERPLHWSRVTTATVVTGLLTLILLNIYDGGLPGNLAAWLVYYILPGIGSGHLLYLSREAWMPSRSTEGHVPTGT